VDADVPLGVGGLVATAPGTSSGSCTEAVTGWVMVRTSHVSRCRPAILAMALLRTRLALRRDGCRLSPLVGCSRRVLRSTVGALWGTGALEEPGDDRRPQKVNSQLGAGVRPGATGRAEP
jgi:hypothetical protein